MVTIAVFFYLSFNCYFFKEVIGSAEISIENKKILTNGIPQLKDLSKKLISLLTEEQSVIFIIFII